MARRRRPARGALAAASIVAALVGLAACASAASGPSTSAPPSASSAASSLVGPSWRITEIDHAGSVLAVPAVRAGSVVLAPSGALQADDTVNSSSGRYRLTAHGFAGSDVATSAVGYAGSDPIVLEQQAAVALIVGGGEVSVAGSGARRALTVGGYTVLFSNTGP